MSLLGARICADGNITISTGATGALKLNAGVYELVFERNVTQCIYSAVSYDNAEPIFVQPRSGNANGVFIMFENDTGTFIDIQFYLTVYCPK